MDLKLSIDRRKGRATSLVTQIVDGVDEAIRQHRILSGEKLPSVRQLAMRLQLSTFTVVQAYQRLVSLGMIASRPGAGFTVINQITPQPAPPFPETPSSPNDNWLSSVVFSDQTTSVKAGCGWLPPGWLDGIEFGRALRSLGRTMAGQVGGYGQPQGDASLRSRIAFELARFGLPANAHSILITQGASQALDLVIRSLFKPDDVVAVEDPCYCNLLELLRLSGVRLVFVPRTPDGLDTEALEDVVRRHQPKALFVSSALHNPTGSSFTLPTAYKVLQIAQRAQVRIIENDVSRGLAPPDAPMLVAMAGLGPVVYVGGFSKTISPLLRVGFVAADPATLDTLTRLKMVTGLTSSAVTEKAVHQVLIDSAYRRHLERLRHRLADMHARIERKLVAAGVELFHRPQAGLFLWGRLPIDPQSAKDVTARALRQGIWLAPGAYFGISDAASAWFRFNVAYCDTERFWRFLEML
ncbi:DNA-binding transcriptional regulator, MocR family, contains an aminotransferase domain [Variovorax sp. YR266]|uniref:aminotransferase-like domain-containing protein n=1 Tax=Variovorax sp. YR266 TaxID=1884386 RepID=UPI000894DACE|nr:PLP-dependent aminotransferase family protein [Variovorax sp. YR266]SDZ70444.1 DNA-binding transcriptional regulator, MocR family, contains an aminotransferase domain [Variovorax sp. YR266]